MTGNSTVPARIRQIKASAGSGKTWTLTRAFLDLLGTCSPQGAGEHSFVCSSLAAGICPPESIIAITFTNATATEMRQRILDNLKKAILGIDVQPALSANEAVRWLEHILRNAHALNVRTIDSLLHLVVRSAALALGIPPNYQPAFSTAEMMENALNILLEEADHDENDKAPSANREETRRMLRSAFEGLATYDNTKGFLAGDKIETGLKLLLDGILRGTFDEISPMDEVAKAYRDVSGKWRAAAKTLVSCCPDKGLKAHANKFLTLVINGDLTQASASAYFKHTGWDNYFLKTMARSPAIEDAFSSYLTAAEKYVRQGLLLKLALRTGPFVALGKRLYDIFLQSPEAFDQLPNSRIPDFVQALFAADQGVPDALCRMGNRLTHFLVDEFQDTSQAQWDAIAPLVHEALSHNGSFTWVGDVKQSIYSWRGGKAALFDDILTSSSLKDMGAVQRDTLQYNRRSRTNVVTFNNAIFSPLADLVHATRVLEGIVPKYCPEIAAEAAPRITTAFTACDQRMPETDKAKEAGGFVSIVAVEKEDLLSRLVLDISQTHDLRPWSDMLVLVPSHRMGSAIAEELVQANIPVVTENSLLLGKHPLVVQTLALMQFLHDPADDIALWTVLTGSMAKGIRAKCGVDVVQLTDWCATRPRDTPMDALLSENWPELWNTLIAPIQEQADQLSPYELVSLWYAHTDVERGFPGASLFLRRFLEVVFMAENKGAHTLAAFLELWASDHAEEKVPMPEGMDAVHIMTTHKAKGLEKPVVFVPCTEMKAKINDAIIVKEVGKLRVAVPLQRGVEPEFSEDLKRSACEHLHALYVACTRAKEALFVYHLPGNDAFHTMLDKAGLDHTMDIGAIPVCADGKPDNSMAEGTVPAPLQRIQNHTFTGRKGDLRIFSSALSLELLSRERGDFLHYCLEHFNFASEFGDIRTVVRQTLDTAIQRYSRPYGAYIEGRPSEKDSLLRALEWFVTQPEASEWLSKGVPEISLTDANGKMYRIDLLVRQQEGALVLDYKSGEVGGGHIAQVRNYLALLSQAGIQEDGLMAALAYLDKRKFCLCDMNRISPLCDTFAGCLQSLGK